MGGREVGGFKGIPCLLLFSRPVMSDSATAWTAAHQASLSLTISRKFAQVHVHCP